MEVGKKNLRRSKIHVKEATATPSEAVIVFYGILPEEKK
jgi:hypothetical protein